MKSRAGRGTRLLVAASTGLLVSGPSLAGTGDPGRGARLFRACVGCHSLERGEHRLGPSLADVFGRRAGTARGFRLYSPALRRSNVVWNAMTLDAWIADPRALVPGTRTGFPGMPDAPARADLVAYLARAWYQDAGAARGGAAGGVLAEHRRAGPSPLSPVAAVPGPPPTRDDSGPVGRRGSDPRDEGRRVTSRAPRG